MKGFLALALAGGTIWSFDKDGSESRPAGFEFATTRQATPGKRVAKN